VQGGLQGGLLVLKAASRMWSSASSSPATQVLEVEDTGGFAKSPLALEDFSGRFKNSTHLQYFVRQTSSRIYGNYPGAFLLVSKDSKRLILPFSTSSSTSDNYLKRVCIWNIFRISTSNSNAKISE
jgi:hypothetical protein